MKLIIPILFVFFSYLTFCQTNADSILRIDIHFYHSDWRTKLENNKLNNSNKCEFAKIKINSTEIDSVGIKFKGHSSFNTQFIKNPFNIDLNYNDKKANYNNLKKIKLNNIYSDPSGIREILSYDIARKYMNLPRANFAEVYVQDSLLGLYVLVEPINKYFLKQNYRYNKTAFFKCDPVISKTLPQCNFKASSSLLLGYSDDSTCYMSAYELKSKYGWTSLMNLLYHIWYNPVKDSKYYHKIDEVLDLEQTLTMLAFNNLFINLDSYNWSGHNYYIFENKDNIYKPLLWDLNMCFGGFPSAPPLKDIAELHPYHMKDNIFKPLYSRLFEDTCIVNRYNKIYSRMVNEIIVSGYLEKRAQELHNLIAPYIKQDPWFYYDDETFENSLYKEYQRIPGIISLMNKRIEYLNKIGFFRK